VFVKRECGYKISPEMIPAFPENPAGRCMVSFMRIDIEKKGKVTMTYNNVTNSSGAEMNEWAETSLWLGICSLVPYLLFGIFSYGETVPDQLFFFRVENALAVLCVSWGLILGSVTLMTGVVAIKQIYSSKNTEKGILSVVPGTVCGLVAIVSNLVTLFMIFASG
jgi:hypothetical protein